MADEVGSADTQPLVVVSADTHAGPLLKEQLRAYCPQRYLAAFDDYVTRDEAYREALHAAAPQYYAEIEPGRFVRAFHNMRTLGHHDMASRLRDMNYDGVAADVIFHGSINDEPV